MLPQTVKEYQTSAVYPAIKRSRSSCAFWLAEEPFRVPVPDARSKQRVAETDESPVSRRGPSRVPWGGVRVLREERRGANEDVVPHAFEGKRLTSSVKGENTNLITRTLMRDSDGVGFVSTFGALLYDLCPAPQSGAGC